MTKKSIAIKIIALIVILSILTIYFLKTGEFYKEEIKEYLWEINITTNSTEDYYLYLPTLLEKDDTPSDIYQDLIPNEYEVIELIETPYGYALNISGKGDIMLSTQGNKILQLSFSLCNYSVVGQNKSYFIYCNKPNNLTEISVIERFYSGGGGHSENFFRESYLEWDYARYHEKINCKISKNGWQLIE